MNQDGLKLNGTHRILVYANDVNILDRRVRAINRNTEALVVAVKEIGLEVIADKTKYMVMSRDQNAGRSHNIKTHNSYCEGVEQCKYLGTTSKNQNSIPEELRADRSKGMFAIIRCRILRLPVCYSKI